MSNKNSYRLNRAAPNGWLVGCLAGWLAGICISVRVQLQMHQKEREKIIAAKSRTMAIMANLAIVTLCTYARTQIVVRHLSWRNANFLNIWYTPNHTLLINCQHHLLTALEKYERAHDQMTWTKTHFMLTLTISLAARSDRFAFALALALTLTLAVSSFQSTSVDMLIHFLHALPYTHAFCLTINNAWSWMVISLMKCHWWMDVVRVWTDIFAATLTGCCCCFTSPSYYYYYYWSCYCCFLMLQCSVLNSLHLFFIRFHFICKLTCMAYAINML